MVGEVFAMRRFLLAATAVISLGGLSAAVLLTQAGAQPAPPQMADGPGGHPGGPPSGPMGGPMGGWRGGPHPGGPGWHHHWFQHARTFGLFYHPDDRQLTVPEVQKIAEAFLLWNGNRTWKVTQVAAGPDGRISFAFATSDGGVIARFTMDSKTGRVHRVG
jgi:hypothetical protein